MLARKEDLMKRDVWGKLKVVKNNRIFVIDDSLVNRPGPRLADGVRVLAEIIHKGSESL